MIYGIGSDVLDIDRLGDYNKSGRLALKILTTTEYNIFLELNQNQAIRYLAKQFACKEAVSKAFGTGMRGDIVMSNMEIARDNQGKPYVNPLGNLQNYMENEGITASHCSISDTKKQVFAVCVLEKG